MAVRRPFLVAFLPFVLLVLACSSSDDPPAPPTAADGGGATPTEAAPSPTPGAIDAPTATPTLEATAPTAADGQRIFDHVRQLAETIGARPAGSAKEQEAIDYISAQLRGFGYEVEVQEFSIATESGRASSLSTRSPSRTTIPTVPFAFSGAGSVRAPLVAAGKRTSADFGPEARGSVVLIERGDLFFNDKVTNARAAGAVGGVIFNNESGIFFGSLRTGFSIPVVAISRTEGQALLPALARPRLRRQTVSGGHYDSVPQAPGASDNASGSATVIEIAGLLARSGSMASNCFILFGAEEIGLIGSRAYVNSLDAGERAQLKVMLNFDMVGVGDRGWLLIGNADLQQRAATLAESLGIGVQRGRLPSTASSDHASFIEAGIPALMIHRINDPLLHTPQDVLSRVQPHLLEDAARLGVALLQSLNAG